MKLNDVFPCEYFRAGDVTDGQDLIVTIEKVTTVSVTGGEKRCLSFNEVDKKLLLNKTNWITIAEITGKDDDSLWIETRVRLVKKRVPFKGELVDAIRVQRSEIPESLI